MYSESIYFEQVGFSINPWTREFSMLSQRIRAHMVGPIDLTIMPRDPFL